MAFTFFLILFGFFILFALGLDAGLWYFDHRRAQNQVDAAAHAAVVLNLPATNTAPAIAAAKDYLLKNGVSQSLVDNIATPAPFNGPIPNGTSDPCRGIAPGSGMILFGQSGAAQAGEYDVVRVCVRRESLVVFGRLAGLDDAIVSAGATARVYLIPVPYSLMAMRHSTQNNCQMLQVTGGATVNITGGGGTYTGAPCNNALNVNNNAALNSSGNDVIQGGTCSGTTCQNVPPVEDPFGHLAQPPSPGYGRCQSIPNGSNITLTPGTYCSTLRIRPGDNVTLAAGRYFFTNGIDMSGGTLTSNGNEVLLYGGCGGNNPRNCTSSDRVDFGFSGGTVNLRGLKSEPALGHLLFWIDRNSRSNNNCLQLSAGSDWSLDGNTYAYSCDVQVSGQTGVALTLNMAIVAGSIQLSGQTTFNIPYDILTAPKTLEPALID
jgi:hypothetical protein